MDRLTRDASERELQHLTGWEIHDQALCKRFDFTSYSTVIEFVNQVAKIAERLNHHPDMMLKYGSVEVRFTTHEAGGLTRADFESARAVDAISG